MRVVFLEDVQGVALGGDVKEVRNGFARNYLIPKKLAVAATHDALQRVKRLKENAEATRLKTLADMKALAQEMDGLQVNVEMRAGPGGRLYGSVTNAIVASALSTLAQREIDRRTVTVPESVRQVGVYEAGVHLHPEVDARVTLVVHAPGTDPADVLRRAQEAEASPQAPEAEKEPPVEAAYRSPVEVAAVDAVQEHAPAAGPDAPGGPEA